MLKSKTRSTGGNLVKIRTKLFVMTFTIISLLSTAFLTVILFWQVNYYRTDMLDLLGRESESIMRQVDKELSTMNSISLSIVYSNVVKDRFSEFLDDYSTNDIPSSFRVNQNSRYLTEILFATIGPNLSVPQVYIYGTQAGFFGTGIDNGYYHGVKVNSFKWFDTTTLTSKKHFTAPHRDERLYSVAKYEEGKLYISLVRQITNNLNVPQGFTEVIQRYDQIFHSAESLSNSNMSVTVFRSDGEVVYPLNSSDKHGERYAGLYQEYMSHIAKENEWIKLKSRKEHVLFLQSEQSDFLMAITVTDSGLMSEIKPLLIIIFGVLLVVIALMVPFCYWASKSFTKPIYRLYHSITSINLETLSDEKFQSIESNILELSELNRVIMVMKYKLSDSMEKLLLTQTHEMQARILALQAQTNPHFIYNTLSTISAMASVNMNDEIEAMCEKLSGLLRYSSGAKESMVTLELELEYTQMYVDCMKTRFSSLEYIVDIQDELKHILVPKLIIQLLVENSIKYCTTIKPPWMIRVTGSLDNSAFVLAIEDNGPGFDEETKEKVLNEIKKVELTKLLPSLEFSGMGILNVYLRMLLIFKKDVHITIGNNEKGGAIITIGAPVLTVSEERGNIIG